MTQAQFIETLIIGGGQAGLATSYYLTQQGHEHLVLEQASQAGNAWRNGRWDSFTLVTPNWMTRLPGAEYQGAEPGGFLRRDAVVSYFEQYIARFGLPVQYGTAVTTVEQRPGGSYRVRTGATTFDAANVVIATGLYQKPKIPPLGADLPAAILQLHSSAYRNPGALPPGAVLVVGSGQSGAQIAEELYLSGRSVFLSIGGAGRMPRRYRGKDTQEWSLLTGLLDRTVDQLSSPRAKFASHPHLSGKNGGHTINLHQFVRDGVTLLGHVQGSRDGTLVLKPDMKTSLALADKAEADFCTLVDRYVAQNGLDAPAEQLPQQRDGYAVEELSRLNLQSAGISTIIWASGYSFDFSLVKLPVFDGDGYPIQMRGNTRYAGLYFVGLPWLYKRKSGLIFGVGDDAAVIASAILERVPVEGAIA